MPKPIYIIVALILFIEVVFRIWDSHEYLIFPLLSAVLILSLIVYPNDRVTNKLYYPTLVKMGSLSYSIYMLHGIVITFYLRIFRFLNIDYLKLELLNLIYLVSLMVIIFLSLYYLSDLIYNRFEKPIRDRVRKLIQN